MKALQKCLITAIALLAIAYGGSKAIAYSRQSDTDINIDLKNQALIDRGDYVAKLADCAACHTAPNGSLYSGGLAMQTPIGAIYTTNITPDSQTGIGTYTFKEFQNAIQHGIRKDGAPLYPAMPYPSYVVMPEEDIIALYAYFMNGVKPIKQWNEASTIPPILNMRWPLAYWQFLFSPNRDFISDKTQNESTNHGAYLVEGPGHCGACHTPRGFAYQEKSLNIHDGNQFLSGAVIDGWRAKSLRSEARGLANWNEKEIVQFLKTGRTNKVSAFGAMADVINHSTQYWSDEDLTSVALYLKQLPPAKGKLIEFPHKTDKTTDKLLAGQYESSGATLYAEHCLTCHRADGKGMPRIIPALENNSAIFAKNAQSIIQITLEGGKMPETPSDRMAFTMPSFKNLGDQEIADVINFIRNGWSNQAPDIDWKEVAHIRQFLAKKFPNISFEQGESHE